ncbi:UDP-glucose 4-epimerase GalE [Bosea rubneri]|uniref:UDP-glucose 4-epimerase n=1 Tax=Bosea rubneri TaxID=3075434 RepID=A0ABU3SGT7_9HYPH|nr:UDP-glucose 4-epimerase GalE [Bosea sp. ZW T0_25]MDU0344002.1 UDP-glucose 4-epimerase GalE [Bosea sp. ZW T0_25]
MAVLVTGGAGYIGSHMVLALLDSGQEPIVLDNLSTGFRGAVPDRVDFYEGDISDEGLIDDICAKHSIDAIIHFAAKTVVPESILDPLGYYLNNTVKARALIDSAARNRICHFIFSSTAAVYGDVQTNPVTEKDIPAPMSPYGRSKLMTEWMLEDVSKAHDLNYVILRYFNVAGADPHGRAGQSTANATHLIKVACQAALGMRASIDVYGTDYPTRDGTCVRDYIHVTDLVHAHLDALAYLRAGGANLKANCGYGRGFSVRQVVDIVKLVSGVDFDVRIVERRPGDPPAIIASNERVTSELGWKPRHDDLQFVVQSALSWEKRLQEHEI